MVGPTVVEPGGWDTWVGPVVGSLPTFPWVTPPIPGGGKDEVEFNERSLGLVPSKTLNPILSSYKNLKIFVRNRDDSSRT